MTQMGLSGVTSKPSAPSLKDPQTVGSVRRKTCVYSWGTPAAHPGEVFKRDSFQRGALNAREADVRSRRWVRSELVHLSCELNCCRKVMH